MHPSQALETWWDCTNSMPEIAGLHAIVDRLLSVPGAKRRFLREFKSKLPSLPLQTVDGEQMLAPAARFKDKRNIENPELYAVFPYRRYGLGKPELEVGRLTFERRRIKRTGGWTQDPIQAAVRDHAGAELRGERGRRTATTAADA